MFRTCFTYIAASSIVVLVAFCNPRDHSGVSQIPSSSHKWSKNNTRKTQHASVQLVRRHPDVGEMQHFSLNCQLSRTCDSLLWIDLSSVTYAQHLVGACKRRQLCHVLADLKIAQQGGCSVYFGQKHGVNLVVLTQLELPHLPGAWMTPHEYYGGLWYCHLPKIIAFFSFFFFFKCCCLFVLFQNNHLMRIWFSFLDCCEELSEGVNMFLMCLLAFMLESLAFTRSLDVELRNYSVDYTYVNFSGAYADKSVSNIWVTSQFWGNYLFECGKKNKHSNSRFQLRVYHEGIVRTRTQYLLVIIRSLALY